MSKASAKQPAGRYATCRELAVALRAVAADPAAPDESGKVFPARRSDAVSLINRGMTSTYVPPTPAPIRAPVSATGPQHRWGRLVLGAVLALALIAGTTVAVLDYFSSRFPNAAEQALLSQLPLALTQNGSCTRNANAERDTANMQASVTCTSDGDVNTVVFTKFASPKALDGHYNAAVVAAGMGQSSGDCRSTERAEGAYTSEPNRTSGRVLCYQERGSSFIKWTDDRSQALGVATRLDPDYAPLRGWWASLMGLKLPATAPTLPLPPTGAQVPNVIGQGENQARLTLERAGFRVQSFDNDSTQPRGIVTSQNPSDSALPGDLVTIGVSNGNPPPVETREPEPVPEESDGGEIPLPPPFVEDEPGEPEFDPFVPEPGPDPFVPEPEPDPQPPSGLPGLP